MIDVGEFEPHHCTAADEEGTIRVCDPRAWLLWLWAVHHGKAYRSSPRGFEAWSAADGTASNYFSIAYAPMKLGEEL